MTETISHISSLMSDHKVRLIETPQSWLDMWTFDDPDLISSCVSDVVPLLDERPIIRVYGRECHQNRNVGFFSDDSVGYHYSRQLAKSKALTPNLKTLLQKINVDTDSDFNGILVNQYLDGTQSIGKHSDDESGIGRNGVVAISSGATRKFRVRLKDTGAILKDVPVSHLSVLHMGGKFQDEFTHEIPVERRIHDPRISFTFRHHLA